MPGTLPSRLIVFALTAFALTGPWGRVRLNAQSTVNATNRFAYGSNIGWIDCRADTANGAVLGDYVCDGFLYAANAGWIQLGNGRPANGVRYGNHSAGDFGVNHDGLGNLRGYAYAANLGWIAFEDLGAPKVDLQSGRISGAAYSANAGWISLSNAVAFVQTDTLAPGVDTDGDGIPDAYEFLWTGGLDLMNATSDLDGDGQSDRQEYQADTSPVDPLDRLNITAFDFVSATNSVLTWTTRATRFYRVEFRPDFNPESAWADAGPGLVSPDTGPTTTRPLTNAPAQQRFLRVEAVRPLSGQ
jgi:hypothetical protein